LIAGTGAASTADAVYLTRQAERLGYDAVAVILPYYSRPTQEEIYHHFVTVARSTSLPVIIYNIPLFTGVNLAPETLARLAELSNIVGVKDEAGANPVQTSDYLRVAPRMTIYCGSDPMILQVLAQGGMGAVSGGSHVLGDLIKTMIGRFKAGAVAEASAIHHRVLPFHRALGAGGRTNPIPMLREAIRLATGIDVGPPRPPLMPPAATEMGPLRDALRAIGRLQQAFDEPAPTR
jgi:4-hydroxy-tetrahydrodipicolinate synthase